SFPARDLLEHRAGNSVRLDPHRTVRTPEIQWFTGYGCRYEGQVFKRGAIRGCQEATRTVATRRLADPERGGQRGDAHRLPGRSPRSREGPQHELCVWGGIFRDRPTKPGTRKSEDGRQSSARGYTEIIRCGQIAISRDAWHGSVEPVSDPSSHVTASPCLL